MDEDERFGAAHRTSVILHLRVPAPTTALNGVPVSLAAAVLADPVEHRAGDAICGRDGRQAVTPHGGLEPPQ